jgi:muramidase (phage lysozyme)
MELTMAEFAAFSTKSKCQILNYKATHVSCVSAGKYDLQLYNMNGDYYVAHVCRTSLRTEKIEPVLNDDMLYMFVKDIDISKELPN